MEEELVRAIREGIVAAQMVALTAKAIVRELVVDVARLHPEPERYAAELYGRVIAHLDPRGDVPDKEPQWQARDLVGAIFRDAANSLRSGPAGGSR